MTSCFCLCCLSLHLCTQRFWHWNVAVLSCCLYTISPLPLFLSLSCPSLSLSLPRHLCRFDLHSNCLWFFRLRLSLLDEQGLLEKIKMQRLSQGFQLCTMPEVEESMPQVEERMPDASTAILSSGMAEQAFPAVPRALTLAG